MIQSYAVYILGFVSVICCSHIAQKKNDKRFLWVAIWILALIAGLRAETVGIDTPAYTEKFEAIANGQLQMAYGLEWTFRIVCRILLWICNSNHFLFFVFAFITHACVLLRLWDFKKRISLIWAVALYFISFYFMSLNIVRQFVAVALIFYGSRYAMKRNYCRFLVFVALAAMFHKSALLGILYVGTELLRWNEMDQKQKQRILKATCATVLIGVVAAIWVLTKFDKYAKYFATLNLNIGFLIPAKMAFFALVLFIANTERKKCQPKGAHPAFTKYLVPVWIYYFIGLAITFLGYLFTFMDRIGLYFYLYEAVFMGNIVKHPKYGKYAKIVIVVLFAYVFYVGLRGNGQGQHPYLFCWQV